MSTDRSLTSHTPRRLPSLGIFAALRTLLVLTTIFGAALAASGVEPDSGRLNSHVARAGSLKAANPEGTKSFVIPGASVAGRLFGPVDGALRESASLVLLGVGLLGTARLVRRLVAKPI